MSKNYYEKTFEVTVENGLDEFMLRFAHRGTLTKIVVKQLTGEPDGYTFELFNSRRAVSVLTAGSLSSSSMSSEGNPPTDAEAWRILPKQTVAPASDTLSLLDERRPYKNTDGTPSNHIRRLYCKIEVPPASPAVEKVFQITLGAETSDL